ncbi:MAG: hypothetical protein GX675_01285 [Erysipelotrichaceae bacterium]|nr:hypothetical protein [Erysipelotrichaceae bacterium]
MSYLDRYDSREKYPNESETKYIERQKLRLIDLKQQLIDLQECEYLSVEDSYHEGSHVIEIHLDRGEFMFKELKEFTDKVRESAVIEKHKEEPLTATGTSKQAWERARYKDMWNKKTVIEEKVHQDLLNEKFVIRAITPKNINSVGNIEYRSDFYGDKLRFYEIKDNKKGYFAIADYRSREVTFLYKPIKVSQIRYIYGVFRALYDV